MEGEKMAILRVGCYERVSTDEQAFRGFSIDAQIDNLTEYCTKNGMKLVDHYTDAGKSGTLPPLKRPALQRLLEDVQAGKIDMVLFTKLDRWFRNVKEYFKVQEILDAHNVEWKAIHEDYDTTTANGRMAITIFLAIAQNERDKTSERIKVVNAHKRKNKEACFGGRYAPFGYMKQKDSGGNTRLVKNPAEEKMCQEFWSMLIEHGNLNMAARYMYNTYGINRHITSWRKISSVSFYCGMYHDIDDFCEPYISKNDWDKIQASYVANKQDTKAKRTYLFSGMMKCPMCGCYLSSSYYTSRAKTRKEYLMYRCRHSKTSCTYKHSMTEMRLERELLEQLPELIQKEINAVELEMAAQKKKPKNNVTVLRERLRTLNASYMAGNKTDEEYVTESAEIKELIANAEQEAPLPERDLSPLKELLNDALIKTYPTLGREEKRDFWRNTLKEIILEDNQIADVKFKF